MTNATTVCVTVEARKICLQLRQVLIWLASTSSRCCIGHWADGNIYTTCFNHARNASPQPQTDLSPGSFCLACKLSQHLLEVRLSTDRNINMLHDWTYCRRTRILTAVPHCTAVLPIVLHCAQQYSHRSLVQHTVSVRWPLSHFRQRQIFKGFLWLLLHRPRPLMHRGGASALSPTSSKEIRLRDFRPTFFFHWWE